MKPVNVWEYERLAEEKLDANAHAYLAGGAGDEVTLRENMVAFERVGCVNSVTADLQGDPAVAADALGPQVPRLTTSGSQNAVFSSAVDA